MPMILSGNYLAILEPTETIFGRTPGKRWHLEDNRDELTELQDLVINNIGLICLSIVYHLTRDLDLTSVKVASPLF